MGRKRADRFGGNKHHAGTTMHSDGSVFVGSETRNRRSVWTVPVRPYSGAHFAVFPPDLIAPCVAAGCRPGGVVLDPFGGSGTTAGVAIRQGKTAIMCESRAEYLLLMPERIRRVAHDG